MTRIDAKARRGSTSATSRVIGDGAKPGETDQHHIGRHISIDQPDRSGRRAHSRFMLNELGGTRAECEQPVIERANCGWNQEVRNLPDHEGESIHRQRIEWCGQNTLVRKMR